MLTFSASFPLFGHHVLFKGDPGSSKGKDSPSRREKTVHESDTKHESPSKRAKPACPPGPSTISIDYDNYLSDTDEPFDASLSNMVEDFAHDDTAYNLAPFLYLPKRRGEHLLSLLAEVLGLPFRLRVVDDALGEWWFYGVSQVVRFESSSVTAASLDSLCVQLSQTPRVSRTYRYSSALDWFIYEHRTLTFSTFSFPPLF